jgi:hypothetical protein
MVKRSRREDIKRVLCTVQGKRNARVCEGVVYSTKEMGILDWFWRLDCASEAPLNALICV